MASPHFPALYRHFSVSPGFPSLHTPILSVFVGSTVPGPKMRPFLSFRVLALAAVAALTGCCVMASPHIVHDGGLAHVANRHITARRVAPRQMPSYTTPPGPQQTGTIAGCSLWAVVNTGDTCATLAVAFGIPVSQFLVWNPAVSSDCTTNFWGGYSYCVRVGP